MAFARFTILISLLLYEQGIRGQLSGVMNGQSVGQNNLNQAFKSNPGSTQENAIQNQIGNSGNLAPNLKAPIPVNSQSLNQQSTISTHSTLSLHKPQSISRPLNLQLSLIPNFQQAYTEQPSLQLDTSFLQQQSQQSAGLQQSQQQPQNVYKMPLNQQTPCTKQINSKQSINLSDLNVLQQMPSVSPVVKQISGQSSQGIPNASFISSTPVSAMLNPCQCMDNTNDLSANYFPSTASTYSIVETPKLSTAYSTAPVISVLSTPSSIPLVTQSIMPYGNQAPEFIESPLRISNNFFIEDETNDPNQDKLISLLVSLLQSPKKSSKSASPSGYPRNTYLSSSYSNQGSKSSSIKSLLPILLNLLTENKEGCGCCEGCKNCDQKRKNKESDQLRIYDGYSKKRDYSAREQIYQKDRFEDDIPRMIREHKKLKKLKNSIPDDTYEDCEDDGAEYGDCSEEEY